MGDLSITALFWAILGATFTVMVGAVVLEAMKRRGFDPVGSIARVFSPEPQIVAETAA